MCCFIVIGYRTPAMHAFPATTQSATTGMPQAAPLGVGGHRPDAKIKMAPRQKIPYFRGAAGGLSQVCRMVGRRVGDLNYSLWLPLTLSL